MGNKIQPAYHGAGSGAGLDVARPGDDQWNTDAFIVETPFAERPLGAVIGGHDGEDVLTQMTGDDFAGAGEVGIAGGYVGIVAGSEKPGVGGVDVKRRHDYLGRIIAIIGRPRHVRGDGADKQQDRAVRVALTQPVVDGRRVEAGVFKVIKSVARRILAVGNLAEGGDLVTQLLESRD